MEDVPVARPIHTHGTTKHRRKRHTSMPLVGFESTISVFELEKTVHTLAGAATFFGWK
jgi:hypothetical protein